VAMMPMPMVHARWHAIGISLWDGREQRKQDRRG